MACEHEHLGIHIHLNRHLASFWIIHYVYMMHITYSTSGFFRWCVSDWCQACFDDRRTRLSQGAWFQCAGDFQHGVSICRGRGSWTWFGCPASSRREMSQCWLGTFSNFAIGVTLIILLMHSWNRPFAGALEQMILRYCSKVLISLILFCLWTLEKTAAVSKPFMPNGG